MWPVQAPMSMPDNALRLGMGRSRYSFDESFDLTTDFLAATTRNISELSESEREREKCFI